MAIDFIVGNFVVINRAYVEQILPSVTGVTLQTTVSLGYIGANPSEVLETGSIVVSDSTTLSFIRARPQNSSNPAYQRNNGTIIYFPSDAVLNNSFELSTAYIDDKCFIKCLNSTGSTITKGQVVRQTGFDTTQQVPIIALAAATSATAAAVMGIASADILTTECGSIIIAGAFEGLATSGFSGIGSKVFLSDTPGAISIAAGTAETVIGRVLSLDATNGSISLVQSLGGGGGGGGFFSDGAGLNAGIGKGNVAPTAAGENSLAQGNFAIASGANSFAQGDDNRAPSTESFAQGYENYIDTSATFANCVQGFYNRIEDGSYSVFAQGRSNTSYYTGINFLQGENNYAEGSTGDGVTGTFLQGRNNHAEYTPHYAKYSFLQGYNNLASGYRTFVQGDRGHARDNDWKTWGSNRGVLGGAQSSRIIKHVTTTTAAAITIATISTLINTTYGMKAIITGRNTTTTTDHVVFTLARALAFRGAGSATLSGSPAFVQEATAGAASTAASISLSTNDILIQVTGEAGQTYQWVIDWHVAEVRT